MPVRLQTVAGLPCWIGPAGPDHRAGIVFRVGHADETIGSHGVTHLVEHLAVYGAGPHHHPVNGYVGAYRCGFHAAGTADEVWGFLRDVVAQLSGLAMDRIDAERRVLRAEQRPPDIAARLLQYRYGEAGPGLAAVRERGLDWLAPDDLRAWAARWFVAGNAALWVAGEPPEGQELTLSDGPRVPEPGFEALPPALPAFCADGTGGVGLGMVAPRSSALVAAAAILHQRLTQAIRTDAGLGYAPYATQYRLTSTHAHLVAGSDCADHHAAAVMQPLWEQIGVLAADGPDADELDRYRADVRRGLEAGTAATGASGAVSAMAEDEVGERPPKSVEQSLEEMDALTPAAVAAALAQAAETAILVGPRGSEPPLPAFGPLREKQPPVTGATFAHGGRKQRLQATIGADGMTITPPDGSPTTVPARWAEGLMTAPDGSLTLLSRDGMWGVLFPEDFGDDGPAVEASMRGLVTPDRVFPIGDARHCADVARLAETAPWMPETKPRLALRALPGTLRDDETLRMIAGAMHRPGGGAARDFGVVAVTDARLIWHGPDGQQAFELADVERVRSRILADLGLKLIRFDLPATKDWRLTVPRKAEEPLLAAVQAGMKA